MRSYRFNFFAQIAAIATALFFAAGAILAYFEQINTNLYILITGVVGSIASIAGLAGLAAPKLTSTDFRNAEADLLQSIAEQVRSTKYYDDKLTRSREELTKLERERAEVELLVRQACLKLFMEERLSHISGEVEKRVGSDSILTDLLVSYDTTSAQIRELDGQVNRSDKAELIRSIIQEVRSSPPKERPEIVVTMMGMHINIRPAIDVMQQTTAKILGF